MKVNFLLKLHMVDQSIKPFVLILNYKDCPIITLNSIKSTSLGIFLSKNKDKEVVHIEFCGIVCDKKEPSKKDEKIMFKFIDNYQNVGMPDYELIEANKILLD